jgi:hypothetical protein
MVLSVVEQLRHISTLVFRRVPSSVGNGISYYGFLLSVGGVGLTFGMFSRQINDAGSFTTFTFSVIVVFVFTTRFTGSFAVGTVVIIRISGTLDVCIRDSRWEVPAE